MRIKIYCLLLSLFVLGVPMMVNAQYSPEPGSGNNIPDPVIPSREDPKDPVNPGADPTEPSVEPEEPDNTSGPCSHLPVLENFTVSQSVCDADSVYVEFTPKDNPGFYLHVQVKNSGGPDVLSAWCTGDEGLCKVVGNGKSCSGTDYTGDNAWCYKGN